MARSEVAGAELALDVIDVVDDTEQEALDAVRRFVRSVDEALPGGSEPGEPSRRVEVIDAALKMVEQLLTTSNEFAERVTESVQRLLPELIRTVELRDGKGTDAKHGDTKSQAAAPKSTSKKATTKSTTKKKATAARG